MREVHDSCQAGPTGSCSPEGRVRQRAVEGGIQTDRERGVSEGSVREAEADSSTVGEDSPLGTGGKGTLRPIAQGWLDAPPKGFHMKVRIPHCMRLTHRSLGNPTWVVPGVVSIL